MKPCFIIGALLAIVMFGSCGPSRVGVEVGSYPYYGPRPYYSPRPFYNPYYYRSPRPWGYPHHRGYYGHHFHR